MKIVGVDDVPYTVLMTVLLALSIGIALRTALELYEVLSQ